MKRLAAFSAAIVLGAAVALVAGCGGGGGGSSLTGGSGSSRAAVLLTDSFREDFAHVWATIYHVELIPQTGSPVVLFDDPAGHQIDLKTLRDASGARFSFLSSSTIPAGTYTGIKVTVGPTMQLFRNGVAVGSPLPVDSSIPKDANGNPVLSLTFNTPKTLGSGTNTLIIDFDLAHFIVRSSGVLPALKEGDPAGTTDPARHNEDEYHGTVSSLSGTSPDLTFTLNRGNGSTVTVTTTAATSVFGTGTLDNGSVVEVTGTLDPTTQVLVATQLEVEPVGSPPTEHDADRFPVAFGTASNLDAINGKFTLTITLARAFIPAQTTINVVTTSTTTFRSDSGDTLSQADFFTALATTPNVTVHGTFDSTTNTFTATNIKISDKSKNGGWEHDHHDFRPGVNGSNWDHGTRHGHG
jgi:hypothetical protein